MKTNRLLLLSLLLAWCFCASCKKEQTITASLPFVEVGYLGGDITLTVQATSHWTVTANYNPPTEEEKANFQQPVWYQPIAGPVTETGWISINAAEGDAGTQTITIHAETCGSHPRRGSVVFQLTGLNQFLVVPVYQQGKMQTDISDKLSAEMKEYLTSTWGITSFTYENILKIKQLWLGGKSFDFMDDLVYLENVYYLDCQGCGLTSFTAKMPSLKVLLISDNQITDLDPDLFPLLEELYCNGNPLESTAIFSAPHIAMLSFDHVPVKEFTAGPGLWDLSCKDCGLERLDLSQAVNLRSLLCSDNKLTEIIFPENPVRHPYINCSNNLLTGLGPCNLDWENTSAKGNPGKDGVFSFYVYDDEIVTGFKPNSWQWQGQEITTELIRVPRP